MGLRRDRKVSGWETGLTFAGELDIMREIFTQQGGWRTDRVWPGNHPGKPRHHLTVAAAGTPVLGSDGTARIVAARVEKALRGTGFPDAQQVRRDENQDQIEPEPTKSHPSQPSPHSLRLELIVSTLDIRAGRKSARDSSHDACARRSKAKGSSFSHERKRRVLTDQFDR
jgi:hypothetical protein